MHRCGRGIRSISSCSIKNSRTDWDPTASLELNHPTLVLLERCSTREHFKQILGQIMRSNLIGQTFPMSRLLLFSAISHPENLDMALGLFHHYTPHPNLYIYNTMISALSSFSTSQSFALYYSMLRSGTYPDKHTLLYLLQASRRISEAKLIHCHAVVVGLLSYGYLLNSLVKMYLENGLAGLAHQVFRHMPVVDAVAFNIMIVSYAKKGFSLKGLELFVEMIGSGLEPDEYTMVSLLVCCGQLGNAKLGKSVHAWIERRKFVSALNLIPGNALLDMYVKLKNLKFARRFFDALVEKDIISWNTMIAGYAKVGQLDLAHSFFNEMPKRNLFSWNSLMSGYSRKGDFRTVFQLFNSMVTDNITPDNVTMAIFVHAASEIGELDQGKLIHNRVVRMQIKVDPFLGSALIDMYCKSGSIEKAFRVFRGLTEKDVNVWTTMITGFAFHGYGSKALQLFSQMQGDVVPNEVTFVAVLTACSHGGLVDEGLKLFNSMKESYGIEPGIEHYGCLVDLFARSGRLSEAKEVIDNMPMEPSQSIWGAVVGACRAHGYMELAEIALTELLKLEPDESGGYILLSNIYASWGRWSCADKIRELMESRGVKKTAACSSVVVGGVFHDFVAVDRQHPRWEEIQSTLNCLKREMKSSADFSLNFFHMLLEPC